MRVWHSRRLRRLLLNRRYDRRRCGRTCGQPSPSRPTPSAPSAPPTSASLPMLLGLPSIWPQSSPLPIIRLPMRMLHSQSGSQTQHNMQQDVEHFTWLLSSHYWVLANVILLTAT